MKPCAECSFWKLATEFYSTAKGTPMHICKECHKARMTFRRKTDPRVQEYDRERAKRPERKKAARRITVRWRTKNPAAYKAQSAVSNALRDGRLKRQPCAICGAEKHVHGHHQDYSKPLDVKWLCAKCHHRIHATFPELGGHHEART